MRALGGLELVPASTADASDSAATRALHDLAIRRRKLALLLYLARQSRPVSRELLATLLWAEESPEKARHSLTEALSHIRRALGRESVATRVQEVALSADAPLALDVRAFEEAAVAGDHARAVALYTGPFLAGVFLDRAAEYDDWAARERDRLGQLFVRSCKAHCAALELAGDHEGAAIVARKWLDEDVESDEAAAALLRAIAAPGTRDALRSALAEATRLETRLAREFEVSPGPAVQTLTRSLEARLLASSAVSLDAAVPDRVADSVAAAVAANAMEFGPPATVSDSRPEPGPPRSPPQISPPTRRPRRTRPLMAGVVAVALLGVAAAVLRWRDTAPRATPRVVIADAQDAGNDPVLARSVALALSVALAQGSGVELVERERMRETLTLMRRTTDDGLDVATATDAAVRLGADRVIAPDVARLGSALLVSARVLDATTGRTLAVERADAVAPEAIVAALDHLADLLRRRVGGSAARAGTPLPQVTTASLSALRAFAEGARLQDRSRFDSAGMAFRRAITLDTGFAMAYAAFGETQHLINRPLMGDSALVAALARRTRLTEREQVRLAALVARHQYRGDSAIALQERWLAAHPTDRAMRSMLAYDLLRAGRHAEARDRYRDIVAVDSLDAVEWLNLAVACMGLSAPADLALARQAYARAIALDTALRTDVVQNQQYGAVLLRAGFPDSAAAVFRAMLAASPDRRARGYRSLGLLALWRGDARTAVTMLDSAVRLHHTLREALSEARARLFLVAALDEAGVSSNAEGSPTTARVRAQLDTVRALAVGGVEEPVFLYWAGKAMARAGASTAARALEARLRARAVRGSVRHEAAALLLAAELAAASGSGARARTMALRGVALDSGVVARETLAWTTRAAGDDAQAAALDAALGAGARFGMEEMLAARVAARRVRTPSAHAGGDALRPNTVRAGAVLRP